jgi:predicted MFS family arabinose efflux permease
VFGAAMGSRPFRLLFAAEAISSVGNRLVPVALAFAVLELTGSVSDLGIVLAAQTVPLVVFVLLGGVWADRLARQRVMLASDCVRAVTQGASAALLLSGSARVWELAALQAVYGAAVAFFGPASTALLPQTVAVDQLQPANALLALTNNVASVLGPAIAGVIVATLGPKWGLAIDATTFIASAAFLSRLRVGAPVATARAGTLAELRAGWRAFRSRAWLWITVAYFTIFIGFVLSPFQVLGPQIARVSLGGPGAWAAISVALGFGSLVTGVIGLRWRPRYPLRVAFWAFLVGGPALFALIAAHAPLWLIIVAAVLDGGSGTLFNVLWFTALQSDVPPSELSRVSSWDYLGSLVLLPLGQGLAGPLAAQIGISTTLYGAGGLLLVLTLAVLAVPAVRDFEGTVIGDRALPGAGA